MCRFAARCQVAGDAGSKRAKSSIDDFALFGYAGFDNSDFF